MKSYSLILTLLLTVFLAFTINAQVEFPKDYKDNYNPVALYSGEDEAVGDTSSTLQIPYDVTQAVCYVHADTITASDTLKGMVIQESPDQVNWYQVGSFTNITASGTQERVALTLTGRFLRFIYGVGGTAPLLDFSFYVTPKQ